jgi:hypothetical protein
MIRYRFLLYTILGLAFGVIDWFYLDSLAHFSWGKLGNSILVVPIIILMNYGIWLVPLIPVVIHEARRAQRWLSPAFAGILTWSSAILSYYAYYAALLSTGRLPNLEHLNIFGEKDESFWAGYWEMFHRIITFQFLEWIVIAVIGGAAIGALSYLLFRRKPLVD